MTNTKGKSIKFWGKFNEKVGKEWDYYISSEAFSFKVKIL
jgi:hypothetical protein